MYCRYFCASFFECLSSWDVAHQYVNWHLLHSVQLYLLYSVTSWVVEHSWCATSQDDKHDTEAQSLQNFKEWLDMFALMFCGSHCLVKNLDGNRIYGLFHHMRKGEHDKFESHLSNLRLWATQCQNAHISAGQYFAASPSGCGAMQFT